MIKRIKEQNPSPSDTVVPKTKWKPDLISQQTSHLILTGSEHSPVQQKLSRVHVIAALCTPSPSIKEKFHRSCVC